MHFFEVSIETVTSFSDTLSNNGIEIRLELNRCISAKFELLLSLFVKY